jgi:hypothetical protein
VIHFSFISYKFISQLVVVVDEVYTDHSHIAGKFTILSSSKVYVGGSVNPRALLGARVHNNFVGCLRKVEFSADTLRLNLIDLARTGSKLISVVGRVDYNCPSSDPQDPVTFTTRDSHLVLPPWEVSKQGVISFKFRTNEPNGLIILSTSTRPPRVSRQFFSFFSLFFLFLWLCVELFEKMYTIYKNNEEKGQKIEKIYSFTTIKM